VEKLCQRIRLWLRRIFDLTKVLIDAVTHSPAIRYIFFSLGRLRYAPPPRSKKDAATIGAMGYSINQNFFQIEDSA
jgi:hypothetical protein